MVGAPAVSGIGTVSDKRISHSRRRFHVPYRGPYLGCPMGAWSICFSCGWRDHSSALDRRRDFSGGSFPAGQRGQRLVLPRQVIRSWLMQDGLDEERFGVAARCATCAKCTARSRHERPGVDGLRFRPRNELLAVAAPVDDEYGSASLIRPNSRSTFRAIQPHLKVFTVRSPIGEHFSKVVDQGPIGMPANLN
jgi:hypothetical protein